MRTRVSILMIIFFIVGTAVFSHASLVSVDELVAQYNVDYNANKILKHLVVTLQSLERALAILEQRYPTYIGKRQWSVRGGKTFNPINQDTPETGFAIGAAMYFLTVDMPREDGQAQIKEWDELKRSSRSKYAQTMYTLFTRKHVELIGALTRELKSTR
jgi:hypothetical protein